MTTNKHKVTEMKHQTPYRLNETSLSPVRERGMVYRGEVITLYPLISETSHFIYLSVTLEISPLS